MPEEPPSERDREWSDEGGGARAVGAGGRLRIGSVSRSSSSYRDIERAARRCCCSRFVLGVVDWL